MPFMIPGQGFKRFSIYKKNSKTSKSGRVHTVNDYEPDGTFIGGFASITEKEQELWKQKQHPVSHKIVSLGVAKNTTTTGNYLVLEEKGVKRYFYVQGTSNPGELDHMARYFCEERKDMKNG